MTIIAIAGQKQNGKDYTFGVLERAGFKVKKLSFAEPLKNMAKTPFDECDINWELKDTEYLPLRNSRILIRKYLKHLGKSMRELYKDFWIELIEPRVIACLSDGFTPVITDMRYLNEFNFMKSIGAITVRVGRIDIPPSMDTDASETECFKMEVDKLLVNDGTSLYDTKVLEFFSPILRDED